MHFLLFSTYAEVLELGFFFAFFIKKVTLQQILKPTNQVSKKPQNIKEDETQQQFHKWTTHLELTIVKNFSPPSRWNKHK